jgi:hypothetical protein
MATQETHYASMAQIVESSPALTAIEQESKRLQLRMPSHEHFVPSVWMTNFHRQMLGGAREWLNLIKLTVPAMVSLGRLHKLIPMHVTTTIEIFSPLLPWILTPTVQSLT